MRTKKKIWKLFIVLVVFPLSTDVFGNRSETSYVANWKGNAQAAFSITIDDNGNGDSRNVQASILEEYGVQGTFFIITEPLTRYPALRQMFLDIFNRGHELGSQTVTHPRLSGANIDLIWSELTESKLFIEELTGAPCITYAAPYGDLTPNIIEVAQELYISARGVNIGINEIAEGNIWNLKTAPRPTPWDAGVTWTNEQYLANLRQYVEDLLTVNGWGIEMWHNLTNDPNEPSSGPAVNETVFRTFLAELTSDYGHRLWVAPQGTVAQYYLERQETTIEILAVTEDVILLNLLFDGDKAIFDEPLTVVTVVPENWLNGELTVMQNGRRLDSDYTIDVDSDKPCLLYDAIPGGGTISIVFEPNRGGLDYGVSYLAKWKNNADAALSLTFGGNGIGDNRNSAAAILEEYGIRGTFNPITSDMNEEMFLDIFHRGHELGSHGVNYTRLTNTSMETIVYELTESKQAIENLTDSPCVSYTTLYGYISHDVEIVARELYLSAVGVREGINAIADVNIFDLQIGPVPPYYDNPKTNWSNEKYCEKMSEYLEQVIAAEGWGIQVFNEWTPSGEFNSGLVITETALRTYLSQITQNLASTVWIAPQGVVARYYLERQGTTIEIHTVTGDSILLNLLFDGDKAIFDEPLTVVTVVPEHWLSGELTVMQRGSLLDYYVEQHETEVRLVYDAMPGGGVVAILFEPTYNQR